MATKRGIQYIPAIDGLRAIAVIAVILYHLGISWIPGGFLGVDLFFVISGYVITRLLLDSIQERGGLDLRDFYMARIRRLLPPLVFMIVVTSIVVGIWAPDTTKKFLTDAPFSIFGGMNWWLVFNQQDYFESSGRPPLLQHTWSLAVEAQFYLLWPLILLLVLKYFGKKVIPAAALIIAAISGVALMLVSFQLDATNSSKVSHIYFGTDTHSIGLFLGAALAVSWIPQNFNLQVTRRAQDFIDGIGVFGFIGILATFALIDESKPTLYRIAFPLAGIFGTAILISIVHPASRFAPLLRNKVLLWIGERSYAIYLWHWVIFQISRPQVDLDGENWALFSLRILLVLAMADISLRLVELPIRSGAVAYWFGGMKYRTKAVRRKQKLMVALSLSIILVTSATVSVSAIVRVDRENQELIQILKDADKPIITPIENAADPGLWVTGDSVILGIRHILEMNHPIALINARVGRQAPELLEVMLRDGPLVLDSPVVFNIGNNNALTRAQVIAIFEAVKAAPQIIVVNTAVPRPWRDANNELINEIATTYPNTVVVRWDQISEGHPEYFAPDGVHLVPTGARAYVAAITSNLEKN
ncbi:MAG: acyltransferase family protein [Actinobacteria bacterium]|nr:acyltransferase family protein [Actinomycetota bacterium]